MKMSLRLNTAIIDSYGFTWFGASESKDVYSHKDAYNAIKNSFDDPSDQVSQTLSATLERSSPNHESATVNLFRYRMPVADGERRRFVALKPEVIGARVTSLPPFSVALEAGLQLGDIVTSINGTSVIGKSADEVSDLQRVANQSGSLDFVVVGADGKQQHIKFEAQDLRWYLERRSTTRR